MQAQGWSGNGVVVGCTAQRPKRRRQGALLVVRYTYGTICSVPHQITNTNGWTMAVKDAGMLTGMEKCAKYLEERGFPDSAKLREDHKVEFAGTARCYGALGKAPVKNDTRVGIIFHYPNTDYSTVRWMGTYIDQWGVRKGKERKLECPHGVHAPAYLPHVDWNNFSGTLYVCESALKALVMNVNGYAAVGGNGTFGLFNKNGWADGFPHELIAEYVKRVEILYDNDYRRNGQVRLAIRRLGNALKEMHPDIPVLHKPLEDPPVGSRYWDESRGKHAGGWGIDDAIVTLGKEWLDDWLKDDTDAREIESTELQKHFDELNDQYAVCHHPDAIINMRTGNAYKRTSFCQLLESTRVLFNDKGKPMSVAEAWVKYPERTEVQRIVYSPGMPQLADNSYNRWVDDGVEEYLPSEDEEDSYIAPFIRTYKNAIPDEETRQLLMLSLAYMVQNRGNKLNKTFLFVGPLQGTGKSLLAQTMGKIVGSRNFSSIGAEDFTGDFNSAFTAKEVVLIDDAYSFTKPAAAKLKRYITDETLIVNPKGVQQYEVDNHAVFFITANEFGVLPFDANDRRVLPVLFDPTVHYPSGSSWWEDYIHWLDHGGYGKVRHWLATLDLGDFNPNFVPPLTDTKRHMIQATKSPVEQWVEDIKEDPEGALGNKRSCFSPKELWLLYSGGEEPTRGDTRVLGAALTKYFWQANGGRPVRTTHGLSRYWVVNGDGREWDSKMTQADIKQYGSLTVG